MSKAKKTKAKKLRAKKSRTKTKAVRKEKRRKVSRTTKSRKVRRGVRVQKVKSKGSKKGIKVKIKINVKKSPESSGKYMSKGGVTGQAGPAIPFLDPNKKEQLVIKVLRKNKSKALSISGISHVVFGKEKKADSWTRNSLRRLVRAGWVENVARGTYKVTKKGLNPPDEPKAEKRLPKAERAKEKKATKKEGTKKGKSKKKPLKPEPAPKVVEREEDGEDLQENEEEQDSDDSDDADSDAA